jgi:hypothetical protein
LTTTPTPEERRARIRELVDLFLDAEADVALASDYGAMTDEELLKSDVGTRVREILFHQLDKQGKEFYANARLKGSGSAMLAGIALARDWVYPEPMWDGFRDAAEWDEPYTPTAKDREELQRRIEARGGVDDHAQAEQIAMKIADENGLGAEETPKPAEDAEPKEWGIVQLSHRTQSPLRRATVHKAPCAALAKAVKAGTTRERTLGELWNVVIAGFYADGPEPGTNLTTVYTLCVQCGADQALQQAKGDDLEAWKNGTRLQRA